ncbi:hypothetical protein LRS13_16440 [Svornostia abyssi]|uniref:Uncharacterized protein n=1 Tax=Svornostia abyssi TaxID=2898438 RepID=A0ABY5PC86_9ACTN|nr:hypothetical protein LRS13_16440 [Parviterribacteraceae bacterium J379]
MGSGAATFLPFTPKIHAAIEHGMLTMKRKPAKKSVTTMPAMPSARAATAAPFVGRDGGG